MVDQDEVERQKLGGMLRGGLIATFNEYRQQHSFRRIDLSRSDMVFVDLSGALLMEADLSESSLSGADLSDANLRSAYLNGADLTGADLSRADLTGVDLTGADLSGALLNDAILCQANLTEAVLPGANLTNADLTEADLRRADVRSVVLKSVVLTKTLLEGIRAEPSDFVIFASSFEEGGDRAVATGSFENALDLYDQADRFFASASSHSRRIALFRKVARLANSLKLERTDIESRGGNILLWLAKISTEALVSGDEQRSQEVEKLHDRLRRELGVTDKPGLHVPAVAESAGTDLTRHAAVAVRIYERFNTETLLVRLGETISIMDETTNLDLCVRFSIPDLQLKGARGALTLNDEELDRLRGENLLKILQQRLRPAVCAEGGAVHQAWLKGEPAAAQALVTVIHKELALPSPFRMMIPVLAVLFVKTGLSAYCGWQVNPAKLPAG